MAKKKGPINIKDQMFFTLPAIVVFCLTVIIPFIYGLSLTFMDIPNIIDTPKFNGINNYLTAFKDPVFWAAMWLTVKYVLASVVFVNVIGFVLAYLVTSGIRAQNLFRTSLFTPNLIGGLVLGYIWQFIFVQTLPAVGEALNIQILKFGWLGDAKLAFLALVIVTIWQLGGYMMIIFIAGLVSLPKDVLEAAKIDGVNPWQRLTKVIFPLMMPSFVVTIFMTLKSSFMVYDINYSLTAGDPYGSTVMVSMHIVRKAFTEVGKYGVGQAEAIMLFLIVVGVIGVQVYLGKKMEVEA